MQLEHNVPKWNVVFTNTTLSQKDTIVTKLKTTIHFVLQNDAKLCILRELKDSRKCILWLYSIRATKTNSVFQHSKKKRYSWTWTAPDTRAWEILMGYCPLIPNTLPPKRLEAPLTTATLAIVTTKNATLQLDVSNFTSTVVNTNTRRMTKREDRIRTLGDNLQTQMYWNKAGVYQTHKSKRMFCALLLEQVQNCLLVWLSTVNAQHKYETASF